MKTVIRNSYTPKTGDYCETIVVDKESGDAYIFDCDGVFTPMPQPVDVEDILRRAAEYTDETVAPLEEKLDTIEEGAQVNVIERIVQNGVELMPYEKTISINTPTKTSDLTNDGSDGTDTYVESAALDDYYTKSETDTQIGYETTAREIADQGLQEQIDAIVASSDVVDIVGTYAALQAYDTSKLHDNDIIKVLTDETRDDATTYYRWDTDTSTWSYIGAEGPFYTKAESDAIFTPMTRTVNGKALSSDVTLTAADVGALPDSTVIPTVNDAILTIQKNGTTVQTFTANQASNATANITVPTDTSDLTNGAGYITSAALPTKTSDLQNDGADGTSTYVEADDLATVATTGSYTDLTDVPAFAAVATSGDYDDLINKPTIPTVNNATLTIQKNGTDVATFTANSSTNKTANITVPTDTSDLTNGAGFITNSALSNYYTKSETYSQGEVNGLINSLNIPTKTSDLTNDSGFISEDELYSEVCDSGTTIAFQGSPAAPISSFGMAGNTSQTGTPTPSAPVAVQTVTGENTVKIHGKNLLEITRTTPETKNGITVTWEGSSFVLNGTASANTDLYGHGQSWGDISKFYPLLAGTYTMSVRKADMSLGANFAVKMYNNSGTSKRIFDFDAASAGTATSTLDADSGYTNFYISITSGRTFNNERFYVQLEKSSQATEWEDYQEQSYEINLGKNLFDKDNASEVINAYIDTSAHKITTGNYYRLAYIECEPNTTYTVSKIAGKRFRVATTSEVPASNVPTSGEITQDTGTSITITTGSTAKYLCVFCYHASYDTLTPEQILASLQIEKGSQATSYAAYFEPIGLCGLGDDGAGGYLYKDSIYKNLENDKWYVHKDIGKTVLVGTESIALGGTSTSGKYRFNITVSGVANVASTERASYSNNFIPATRNETYACTQGMSLAQNLVQIYCEETSAYDLDQFKAWLASHNTTAYYPLATPTDTEITNAALVAQLDAILGGRTYSSATNISTAITAGNARGELEVCYTKTILPIATETSLGMVQIGSGLSITQNGVLSATGGGGGSTDWSDITNKPTDVSYWTNDAGYITSAAIPTTVSSFTNDAGYITSAAIPTVVSAFTNDAGYLTSSALSNYYTKTETYSQGEVNSLINTISVPTKTSDLVNDGDDGVHAFLATDDVATVATSGDYDDLINKPVIPTYSDFTGATSGTAGAHGLVPAPAAGDQNKVLKGDGTWKEVSDKFVIMKYGESNAWAKFIDAYDNNKIVYCRASSNANPASGAQTRLAFMAYVSAETNPTNVEFQYVRSVSSKTSSQPVDQVFVYKLTNANGGTWSVETRDMAPKLAAGTNTSVSYSSGTYTVSATQPTVGDATLTIQKNGTTVDTFTANATSNKTINLTMPNITVQDTDPGEGAPLAADNYIGVYDIPASPIDGDRLIAGSVATAALADSAVTTAKINNGAVTAAKMDTQSYSLTSLPAHSGGVDRYKVYRVGNLVTININSIWLNSVAKDSWTTLGALPAGLYPSSADDEQCGSATVLNDSGNVIGSCALIVNNAGNLQFKSGVARTGLSAIRGSMSYVITW